MHPRLLIVIASLAGGCLPDLPEVDEPCAEWEQPGLYRVRMERPDSNKRKPYVYIPSSAGPRDLVVLLHGGGMNGPKIEDAARFEKGADELGFVLVYPNGLGWPIRYWNVGPDYEAGHDDVDFLDDLVRYLEPRVCSGRVLGTGFSNGGMMAHRWACQGSEVHAIGPVSGTLMTSQCSGAPIPVRHYHGTDDPVVPMDGGAGSGVRGSEFSSVEETMAVWRERNGCSDLDPQVTVTGDTTCTAWECEASTVQCIVEGWGHNWPGGAAGSQTDADATRAIYDWFVSLDAQQVPSETSEATRR